ncbi:MAG: family 43 glycosylhydrolase [Bacteroidales bacterium]|nr:family 43 glycosylhydrolase [Bacteroidales bacterium]
MRKNLILAAALLLCSAAALAQPRYCNPLPMPMGQGGNASGDVTVLQEGGKYYMYCTGGGAWVSDDLLNWEFHYVQGVPVAPDIVKYRGKFYLSGNTDNLYVADNPLGPFENLGTFKNTGPVELGWNGGFDTKIFVDDDGQPYLFWPGRGISGIYGVKLDPDDLTKFAGTPVHLFGFNPMHAWERYGEKNEYPGVAWIEGPWVIKRGGIYYLEYSASGTQWKTYAEGYYTATSPLGPYTYAANNPLLRKTEGLVTGTAHGSIVQAPDGEWWQFYTIVLSNPPGGRRIGMDRVRFDEDGLMSVTVTDSPQPAPGFKADPDKLPSIPVTINKMLAMNALSKASSEQEGFPAAYAVDDFSGTIWRPAADDAAPQMTIELSPATRFDVVQLFTVDGMRIMFGSGARRGFGGRGGGALPVYKFRLETSMDGESFTTVLDCSGNDIARDTFYEDFAPVRARFVRLTITDWPRTQPLGVIDFTVFGRADGWLPASVATPTFTNLPLDSEYQRSR